MCGRRCCARSAVECRWPLVEMSVNAVSHSTVARRPQSHSIMQAIDTLDSCTLAFGRAAIWPLRECGQLQADTQEWCAWHGCIVISVRGESAWLLLRGLHLSCTPSMPVVRSSHLPVWRGCCEQEKKVTRDGTSVDGGTAAAAVVRRCCSASLFARGPYSRGRAQTETESEEKKSLLVVVRFHSCVEQLVGGRW